MPDKRQARRVLDDGGMRLKLLRYAFGGISPAHAAEVANLEGFGAQKWTFVEAPNHHAQLYEDQARVIAEAFGVPFSFFTAPLHHLGDVTSGDVATPVEVPPDPAVVAKEQRKAEKRASRSREAQGLADDALAARDLAKTRSRPAKGRGVQKSG